ncbi:hypothetical protein DMH18_27255 [Streptomyces sp. WAC 06783]|uniref:hypothetical protein n=1 Tax=Streptomyces sp. WAC 06783 TaxID=2203211 RepID=UPI000F741C87|nr:hypothetical protein [Streptomyces sp. WAC 06783]RSO06648.1 hypothetical protein DMH18_27255 [Streptomyces sp. WAC 06783]
MGDSTVWTLAIAAVTGGTAVLASWVAGRGSTRAARVQAEIAARAQRAERLRESRRAAYLDLIEQTHRMGELYWEILAVLRNGAGSSGSAGGSGGADGPDGAGDIAEALKELHDREIAEYAKIRRCARVVELEGPPEAAAAALALQRTTGTFYRCVKAAMEGDADAREEFRTAFSPFWAALEDFVEAARTAHQAG